MSGRWRTRFASRPVTEVRALRPRRTPDLDELDERAEGSARPAFRWPWQKERTWSNKAAWLVLVGGGTLLAVRASLATVVQIHGDGMAPNLVDGDTVLMRRGPYGIERGDVVVYDPVPPTLAPMDAPELVDDELEGPIEDLEAPLPGHDPVGELRNTAVVDPDELEGRWKTIRRRSGAEAEPRRALRVGRIVALPGDLVTFNAPESPHGVAINGEPLKQKAAAPIRVVMRGAPQPGEDRAVVSAPQARESAIEWIGDRHYTVLVDPRRDRSWPAMELPGDVGPVEMEAEGYLILADNRDEGACCDSRALGWIPAGQIAGKVVMRLAGNEAALPDREPGTRGVEMF